MPARLLAAAPPAALRNVFENTAAVQFNHRMLAYATLAGVASMWRYGSQLAALPPAARLCLHALAAATAGQVGLLLRRLPAWNRRLWPRPSCPCCRPADFLRAPGPRCSLDCRCHCLPPMTA